MATQAFKITAEHDRTTDKPHGVPLIKGVGYLPGSPDNEVLAHRYASAGHRVERVDAVPDAYTELVGDSTPMSRIERRIADVARANKVG